MKKSDFEKADKAGQVQRIDAPEPAISSVKNNAAIPDNNSSLGAPAEEPQNLVFKLEDFIIVLRKLQQIKRHVTTAPTLKPKNLLDQIQFYDDGATRRVYLYVNNTWRYVALT